VIVAVVVTQAVEPSTERVQGDRHELLRSARRALISATGLPFICPDSAERYARMASFLLPACVGPELQQRLCEEYHIEMPVVEWPPRAGKQGERAAVRARVSAGVQQPG
jgi:hypothetical protein